MKKPKVMKKYYCPFDGTLLPNPKGSSQHSKCENGHKWFVGISTTESNIITEAEICYEDLDIQEDEE